MTKTSTNPLLHSLPPFDLCCSSLTKLNISHFPSVTDDGVRLHLTAILLRSRSLQRLTIQNCWRVTSIGLAALVPLPMLLTDGVAHSHQSHSLQRCHHSTLVALDITDCLNTEDATVMALIHYFNDLQCLNLSRCSLITDASLRQVASVPR